MATRLLDNFVDSNMALTSHPMIVGSGWVQAATRTLNIVSNSARASGTGSNGCVADAGNNNGVVTATLNLTLGDLLAVIMFRNQDSSNGLNAGYNSARWAITEVNGGASTGLVSVTENIPAGTYNLELSFYESLVTLRVNGVQKVQWSIGSKFQKNTQHGLQLTAAGTPASNWSSFKMEPYASDGRSY